MPLLMVRRVSAAGGIGRSGWITFYIHGVSSSALYETIMRVITSSSDLST